VYTEEGGVKATIWTDAVQLVVYLAGALVCLVAVVHRLPMSVGAALGQAAAQGKLRLIDLSVDPHVPFTLWAGVIGGAFLTLATHGTDHYLVQRLLVAKGRRDAALGLALTGPMVLAQFVLFLVLGALLFVHYGGRTFARGDEVLPTFIATSLSPAATGFILAAIVAAALSPSLNSMASATLRDFYLPYLRPQAAEREQMRVGKAFTIVWGVAQIAVAFAARDIRSALDNGLAVLGYASGPTVGAFLLAVLTRRAGPGGTIAGMASGLVASLLASRLGNVAWTWNVAVGAVVTFAIGSAAGLFRREVAHA
jgi:Na+/proline symporter